MARFKSAFKKDLAERQADMNNEWLKLASALDPCFKDLKCLSRGEREREQVWSSLEKILQEAGPSTHTPQLSEEHEPAKKRRILLLGSESEEENHVSNALQNYRAQPTVEMDKCPLE